MGSRGACRICGAEIADSHTIAVREMHFGTRKAFCYTQCPHCQCLQLLQLPEDPDVFYSENYYRLVDWSPQQPWVRWAKLRRNRYEVFHRDWIGWILHMLHPGTALRALALVRPTLDMNILDVGCGPGQLLFELQELGFQNLMGVDPLLPSTRYVKGVHLVRGVLDDIRGLFDVVMFHHSFEHIPNPEETLLAAAQLLKPTGHILIRMPTVSSWAWKYYGPDWVQLDAPRHLFIHSLDSVAILARKAGLRILLTICDSNEFQYWASESYRRNRPLVESRVPPVRKWLYRWRAERLNQQGVGDQRVWVLSHRDP